MVASNLSRPKFSIIPVAVMSIHIYIYMAIHIYSVRGCPRVPTGAHGCPRVSEKASFLSFSPLDNELLRVKNVRKSWLSDLSVSTHGRVQLEPTKILRNTSCSYEYIYVYVYIIICMNICEYVAATRTFTHPHLFIVVPALHTYTHVHTYKHTYTPM